MIPLSIKLKRLKPPDAVASFFNMIVREGLELAGKWWLEERFKLHFGPNAFNIYKYKNRTIRTIALKLAQMNLLGGKLDVIPDRIAARIAVAQGRVPFVDPMPLERPENIDRQGQPRLRDTVESQARVRATATANKQTMRITLPLGHPINPKNVGELSTVNDNEWREMRRIVVEHVQKRLRQYSLVA